MRKRKEERRDINMKDGFIKTAAITPKIKIADCKYNAESIISEIKNAAEAGVKLAVFPELTVTGASCGDLFAQPLLVNKSEQALCEIKNFTKSLKNEIIVLIGAPIRTDGYLYNACVVMYKGEYLGVFALSDREKYFRCLEEDEILETRFGLMGKNLVFHDIEMPEFSFSAENTKNASIIISPYAEAETVVSAVKRSNRAVQRSSDDNCAYVCAGAGYGESTTDMTFSGHCLIVENGRILSESKPFEYKSAVSEIDVSLLFTEKSLKNKSIKTIPFKTESKEETKLTRFITKKPFVPFEKAELDRRCEIALKIQANSLKKRVEHIGAKRIVVGLSGGLDSTLALISAAKAADITEGIERSDVLAVTMPCFGTSKRTKDNAKKLAFSLGVSFREIDIKNTVLSHFKDIGHDENKYDAVYENAQARERTQVLMDIANSVNGLMIGTGDLSELALGWATYNGDHMSMYGVNAGIPKTFMREIVRYVSNTTEDKRLSEVLGDILDTPISPELLPVNENKDENKQKTEELIGSYELNDFFIYNAIKLRFPPKKVLRLAEYAFKGDYTREEIKKRLKGFYTRFFSMQFKRSCMADGAKIGSLSFSPRKGLDMPSDAESRLWIEETEDF